MIQLNSAFLTALQRRYLPVIMGVVLLGILATIMTAAAPSWSALGLAAVVMALVGGSYWGVYRALVYPTADRVVLDGDVLRVTRDGKESVIKARSVVAIRCNPWISPEIVTLDLAPEDGSKGAAIQFIPPARLPSEKEHPVLGPLRAAMRRVG